MSIEITKTQANFIKNMAKEYVGKRTNDVNGLSAVTSTIRLIDSEVTTTSKHGNSMEEIKCITKCMAEISDCYGLSAYLGEAIKQLDSEMKAIEKLSLNDLLTKLELTMPTSPVMVEYTKANCIADLTDEERGMYYSFEAITAHYGKLLHEGAVYRLNAQVKKAKQEPVNVNGTGRDAIVTEYKLSVDADELEAYVFELQGKYREAQKALNKLNSQIERRVSEVNANRLAEYQREHELFNAEINKLTAKAKNYQDQLIGQLSNKRITVPKSLEEIYNKLSSLG